jgi:hypothetical protein
MLVVGHGFDSLDSPRARPPNQGRLFTPLTIHGSWRSIGRVFHEYISSEKNGHTRRKPNKRFVIDPVIVDWVDHPVSV